MFKDNNFEYQRSETRGEKGVFMLKWNNLNEFWHDITFWFIFIFICKRNFI